MPRTAKCVMQTEKETATRESATPDLPIPAQQWIALVSAVMSYVITGPISLKETFMCSR